jgi:hypothetical protein
MASARKRGSKFTGLFRDADGKQQSAGSFGTYDEALARAQVTELDARPPKAVDVHPTQNARQGHRGGLCLHLDKEPDP